MDGLDKCTDGWMDGSSSVIYRGMEHSTVLLIKMMMMMTLLKRNLFKDEPSGRVGGVLKKEAAARASVTLVLERRPCCLAPHTHVRLWQPPAQKQRLKIYRMIEYVKAKHI